MLDLIAPGHQQLANVILVFILKRKGGNKGYVSFSLNQRLPFLTMLATIVNKKDENGFIAGEARGKHGKQKRTDAAQIQSVIDHINSFPRIESHYCRARTKKE